MSLYLDNTEGLLIPYRSFNSLKEGFRSFDSIIDAKLIFWVL